MGSLEWMLFNEKFKALVELVPLTMSHCWVHAGAWPDGVYNSIKRILKFLSKAGNSGWILKRVSNDLYI